MKAGGYELLPYPTAHRGRRGISRVDGPRIKGRLR